MKRSKHGLFVFPLKKTLIWRRHCSIGQSCCSMTSKRSIGGFLESSRSWSFFSQAFTEQTKYYARVCSINQTYRYVFALFCCFCFVLAFSFQGHTKITVTCKLKSKQCYQQLLFLLPKTRKDKGRLCLPSEFVKSPVFKIVITIILFIFSRALGGAASVKKLCPQEMRGDLDLVYLDYIGLKQVTTKTGALLPQFK